MVQEKETDVRIRTLELELAATNERLRSEIARQRLAEQTLAHRLAVEKAVAQVSGIFATAREVDFTQVLAILGEAVGASRAFIFLLKDNGRKRGEVVEWCAPGVQPKTDKLQHLETSAFPWTMDRLRRNEDIAIREVYRLPQEAKAERDILQALGIESVLMVPMFSSGELVGFLGFDDTKGAREWGEEDVRLLRTASETLLTYLERKGAEQEKERLFTRERALAHISRALVSELELERVAEVVMDQSLRVLGVDGVALWLADPTRRELNLLAYRNLQTADAGLVQKLSYDAPLLSARAARTRRIQTVEDILKREHPLPAHYQMIAREGMRGALAAPLLARNHLVGAVSFLTKAPRRFSPEDLDFNATVADLFAVAIEKARLHRDLRHRERQVSLLLKATADTQDEERHRVRLEVQHGVAQTLAPVSDHLQALVEYAKLPKGLRARALDAAALVQNAIREAQDVIATLDLSRLNDLGLLEALRSDLADLTACSGLRVDLEADEVRLARQVETALYRIIRAAVNNVIKHARASRVAIRVKEELGSVVVSIEDDGVGFDLFELEHQARPTGTGIPTMRKYVESLGGSLTVKSRPGEGTRVRAEVPLVIYEIERDGTEGGPPAATQSRDGGAWPDASATTVLIVDDHELTRQGLRAMLQTDESLQVVGEASDGLEALRLVAELRPRVVLMDLRMPNLDGLEATRRLKVSHPTTSVIIMTNFEDDTLVVSAIEAGAAGYLLKDVSRELLLHAIGAVSSGGMLIKASLLRRAIGSLAQAAAEAEPPRRGQVGELSKRESEVLRLLVEGCTNKEIGKTLGLAEITVKKHVQSIIAKLQASDRTQAAIVALRLGIIK